MMTLAKSQTLLSRLQHLPIAAQDLEMRLLAPWGNTVQAEKREGAGAYHETPEPH